MRYVDDTVFVLDTREGLQSWGTAAKIEIEKAGLNMNVKKTKTMVKIKARRRQHQRRYLNQ